MTKERFQYLLRHYKLNVLSEQEQHEWDEFITTEDCRALIESDIDTYMNRFLVEKMRKTANLHRIWNHILAAIR